MHSIERFQFAHFFRKNFYGNENTQVHCHLHSNESIPLHNRRNSSIMQQNALFWRMIALHTINSGPEITLIHIKYVKFIDMHNLHTFLIQTLCFSVRNESILLRLAHLHAVNLVENETQSNAMSERCLFFACATQFLPPRRIIIIYLGVCKCKWCMLIDNQRSFEYYT